MRDVSALGHEKTASLLVVTTKQLIHLTHDTARRAKQLGWQVGREFRLDDS